MQLHISQLTRFLKINPIQHNFSTRLNTRLNKNLSTNVTTNGRVLLSHCYRICSSSGNVCVSIRDILSCKCKRKSSDLKSIVELVKAMKKHFEYSIKMLIRIGLLLVLAFVARGEVHLVVFRISCSRILVLFVS